MTDLIISAQNKAAESKIFSEISACIDNSENFVFDAGAGAGKTYCLVQSLRYILSKYVSKLKTHNQLIRCITYTNIAAKEIKERLGNTELVKISTIHDFLWEQINLYQEELVDIHKQELQEEVDKKEQDLRNADWAKFYQKITDKDTFKTLVYKNEATYYKNKHKGSTDFKNTMNNFDSEYLSNVSNFKKVIDCILGIHKFNEAIKNINDKAKKDKIDYTKVSYNSLISYDRLHKMQFSHDTLLKYSQKLVASHNILQKIISDKYPYILVDEYQDTAPKVIEILAMLSQQAGKGLLIGYYGDKKQNIYAEGVGDKLQQIHPNLKTIKKEFNRRSAISIINVGSRIRNDDLKQKTIYDNCPNGTVSFHIGKDIDKFIQHYHTLWEGQKIDCLLLKNEDIAQRTKFGKFYDFFKEAPFYKMGRNYMYLRDHILSKEPEKLGKIQLFIYRIIDFKNKLNTPSTLVQELISNNILQKLSICELRELIDNLKKIEGSTLKSYFSSFFNMLLDKSDHIRNTLKTFITEDDITNEELFNSYLLNTLFNAGNEEMNDEELNESKVAIDNFMSLNINIFENWYNYINNVNSGNIAYHTYHGTKGDEFDNVLIIMEKDFGRTNLNFFGNLLKKLSTPSTADDDKLKSARNIFYVAATRAKNNLAILYTDFLDDAQKEQIKNAFGEIDETTFKGAQNA